MNAPVAQEISLNLSSGEELLTIPVLNNALSEADSQESVLHLINSLYNYHQAKNFSHIERFGTPDAHSEKLQQQLKQSLQKAKNLFQEAQQEDSTGQLQATLTFSKIESPASAHSA